MPGPEANRNPLECAKLVECGQEIVLLDFDRFEAERHVCKHVLDAKEGWSLVLSVDPGRICASLSALGCLEDQHGHGCPRRADCQAILDPLVNEYRAEVVRGLNDGATVPRHSHELEPTRAPSAARVATLLFLSDVGVIVRTYPVGEGGLTRLRTAYRHGGKGQPLASNAEYVREAREYVCYTRGGERTLCTPQSWGCGRMGGFAEALRAALERRRTP